MRRRSNGCSPEHLGPLQRWASGRLPKWARGLADTDDLVQDTLLQTSKRIEAFEPRRVGALQAYLRQAVLNRLRDELRRKARQGQSIDLAAKGSPLEDAIGREEVERYERALERLKPEDREAIIAGVELSRRSMPLQDEQDCNDARGTNDRAHGLLPICPPSSTVPLSCPFASPLFICESGAQLSTTKSFASRGRVPSAQIGGLLT